MQEAINEMSHYLEAQWLIINDSFEQALSEMCAIIVSQRLKLSAQKDSCQSLLSDLLS